MTKRAKNGSGSSRDTRQATRDGRRRERDRQYIAPTPEELEAHAHLAREESPRPRASRRNRRSQSPKFRPERALRDRLVSVGVHAALRGDTLYVGEACVGTGLRAKLASHHDLDAVLADDEACGRLIDRLVPDVLKLQVREQLAASGHHLYVRPRRKGSGFEIVDGTDVVAHVTSTVYTTSRGEQRRGLFWAPGPHWTIALELLLPRGQRRHTTQPSDLGRQSSTPPIPAPETLARPKTKPRGGPRRPRVGEAAPERYINWSQDVSGDLTERAKEASDALHLRRIRSDDDPVVLDCAGGIELTFQPVRVSSRGRLDLPFSYAGPEGRMVGRVYLRSPKRPLAIHVSRRDPLVPLAEAWCLVLEAAAARYCGPPGDPQDERSDPLGFTPDRGTRERSAHRVLSHRARLPEGHRASDDAVKAAEEVGIELPDGCTWRRGYVRGDRRGSESDLPMRYRWHPSTQRPPTNR